MGSKREREKEKEVSVELFFHRPQHLGLRKKVAGGEKKPSAFKLLHVFLLIPSDDDGLRVPFWSNCVVVSYFRLVTDDTYFQVRTVEKQCTATRSNVLYSSRRIKEA